MNRSVNRILIPPRLHLIHQLNSRPVAIYEQNLPRLKNAVIKYRCKNRPHSSNAAIYQLHKKHISRINHTKRQQADYDIHNHIGKKSRQKLRQHDLHTTELPNPQGAIHGRKEIYQNAIKGNHRPVSLSVKVECIHRMPVNTIPEKGKNNCHQYNTNERKYKKYCLFIRVIIFTHHERTFLIPFLNILMYRYCNSNIPLFLLSTILPLSFLPHICYNNQYEKSRRYAAFSYVA